MKGYKAFTKDLKCRDMQYEIGKEYKMDDKPLWCRKGFHFCTTIADVYNYYPYADTRVCEVEALGDIDTDDNIKYCTNHIKILKEIKDPLSLLNYGIGNCGADNTGDNNWGLKNTGYSNAGDKNTGMMNYGDYNTGNYNRGYKNTGNCNKGSCNTGDFNVGHSNTGSWNIGNCHNGVFNTIDLPKLMMFDKLSDWTIVDWIDSAAHDIMHTYPNPGLYSKDVFDFVANTKDLEPDKTKAQEWWDNLEYSKKQTILSLPNFDADKFMACTGVDVSKDINNKEEIHVEYEEPPLEVGNEVLYPYYNFKFSIPKIGGNVTNSAVLKKLFPTLDIEELNLSSEWLDTPFDFSPPIYRR